MSPTRTLRILLALALLAVWQAALLHPLQHVDAKGAFVHVPGSHLPKAPGDQGGSKASCDAIAAVAVCIDGSHAFAFGTAEAFGPIAAGARESAGIAAPLAYRSQAPPAVL
jgi:hypothetical protein